MKKYNLWIEIPGTLSVISMFLAIWVTNFFWQFFGTSILLFLIAIANTITNKYRKQTE